MAWVAEHDHSVYERRFEPFVFLVLATCVYGIAQAPNTLALLATFVVMYFYIDFYSGVLHVVLDNPRFVRLPVIGVPCVEFQWHHTFAYDISTRRLLDVWGDLNVLLLVKSLFLFGICGFTNGHSRRLIQAMLRVVPNGFPWPVFFGFLTALDLVAVVWLIERI